MFSRMLKSLAGAFFPSRVHTLERIEESTSATSRS